MAAEVDLQSLVWALGILCACFDSDSTSLYVAVWMVEVMKNQNTEQTFDKSLILEDNWKVTDIH